MRGIYPKLARDVTIEKQAWEIDEFTATITENDRIVHDLEERNRLLIIENERYKTELNKQQDKIIRFNNILEGFKAPILYRPASKSQYIN